jgi:hypothetical protein
MPDEQPAEGGLMRWVEPPPGGCTIPWAAVQRIRVERPSLHIEDLLLALSLGFAARFTGEQCQVIAGEIRSLRMQLRQPYPGRTDETERAFEETSVTVDSEQIIAHLIDQHRRNHPHLDTAMAPNPNPHNRTEEETLRWRAYNLGRLHAFIDALNAIRTAQAGKDIGP